jgi:benzoate/toluate 1,2-dioxygenase reductase subunit
MTVSHSIALSFEDGITRFVVARPDETVADAAYRNGINIPMDCGNGACGACKCRIETGRYDAGAYVEEALTDAEAALGFALACQVRPESDLAVSIMASSSACKTKPRIFETTLRAVARLTPTTIGFTLDRPADFNFLPGQYVNLGIPGADEQRSYSMSSAPGASPLTFLVRDIPDGRMSTWLRDAAKPGATMRFSGPAGAFYLRDTSRPLLLLAGGTGLAPFLSMLGQLAATGYAHPVRMVYGVTNEADLAMLPELQSYAEILPDFAFVTCVAAADSAHPRKGYVTAHVDPAWLHGGDVDLYLCGPPPMVEAVRTWLGTQGIVPAAFHYEKFAPAITEPQRRVA